MREFGQHLTIDASLCNRKKLMDQSLVYDILNKLPGKLGMSKMILPYAVKWLDPGATIDGISGFVMIAESHVSIHTFPEKDYAFIDIFSCKPFDVNRAAELLVNAFDAKKFTKKVIKRGLDFPRTHPDYIYEKPEQIALSK
ncbi:adenosylmethionine decarboxylase [archaeon]|jgi:S-adenosylmethionine decarboxylase|nr:adenosylmethionine decarboxylase [archaeon]MDP6547966.1 adenosylmethionine decarboxylase [Candidatus Woesearchaeota archaeon]|tara:strand:- start:75409 stop:75831 length:423 start_codon:yes stop_codon:yes gene_type:complete